MRLIRVGAGALALGVLACSDPVSRATDDEPAANQDALADRRGSDDKGDNDDRHNESGPARIEVYDDCDPRDGGWAPTGGCTLRGGQVSLDEFNLLLQSPLSQSVVGHPAWRNEPSYLRVRANRTIAVENEGGRFHTFTKVAQFGGGRVPPLNQGLTMAPECALAPGAVDPAGLAPDAELKIRGLAVGNHRYQCCIHPWMRALVKVSN
jgi:hypothetical protein